MMREYFENLARGIEDKIQRNPAEAGPRKRYALEIARLGRRLYDPDNKVAWCGVVAPFDLLRAMGVDSCFVEFIGAMLASTGTAAGFLEKAEQSGFGPDICGYHRAVLGAARAGVMPEPAFLIGTTCPCTGGLGVIENLARQFAKDLFVLQIPQDDGERQVRYLADQLRDLTDFVAAHTGRPLSPEQLRATMERTNRTRALLVEMYELARRVPSPVGSRDLRNFGIVGGLFLGTEGGVEVAQAFRDHYAAMVERGASGAPGERIRLLWIQNRIQFKHPFDMMMEDRFQAAVVVDELNSVTWEPIDLDDPFVGMAKRAISIPFNGPTARRVRHLQKLAAEYQIHGAINPCHWGCRQGTGARGLLQKGLGEVGVPVLNLEVDCIDTRNFAEGQLLTRLEAFLETIGNQPSPWA